jgi:hypothetical protein
MNYWIFNVASYSSDVESYTARQIYERRMQDKFWGLGTRTPNRRNVRKGDQVVFYIARPPEHVFAGTARLGSNSFDLNPKDQASLSHGSAFFRPEHGVWLEAIETWEQPCPMASMASSLKFIKDPSQWWIYLQGGIRQIEESDYEAIVSGVSAREPIRGKLYANSDAIDDIGTGTPERIKGTVYTYDRDAKIRMAVMRRAKGKCEFCGELGFKRSDGTRYLECHHIIALAKDGTDRMTNVIALCPNHHREAHFGKQSVKLEREMIQKVMVIEGKIKPVS